MATPHLRQYLVGNYTVNLNEKIGKGTFGTIYNATNKRGTHVAAKEINIRKLTSKDIDRASDFCCEVHRHKNLIYFEDYFEEVTETDRSAFLWIFMDFCSEGDLNKYFLANFDLVLPTEAKILLMKQMAEGLKYLHDHERIHSNLKPGHILIANSHKPEYAVVKISFTGLREDLELDDPALRNRVFQSPEFWNKGYSNSNTNDIDTLCKRSDIFSLGLIFLSMIQAKEGEQLIPTIENNSMEVYRIDPIGKVMSFRESGLKLVNYNGDDSLLLQEVKKLTERMTYFTPDDRIDTDELVEVLANHAAACATPGIPVSPLADSLKVRILDKVDISQYNGP